MTIEEFTKILDEIKPFTDYIYLHVLGEPLLHQKLAQILKIACEKGFFVNLTTNATLLKKRLAVILLGNIRQINLSLHSFEEDNQELFDRYLDESFFCVKEILAKTTTIINFRIWNKGQNKIREKQILEKLAVEFNGGNALEAFELKKNRKIAENCYLSEAELFEWPSLSAERNGFIGSCHGLIDHCAILVDGTVVPCCLDADGVINLGNIYENDFASIINGVKSQRMFDGFKENKLNEELCQKCNYRGNGV